MTIDKISINVKSYLNAWADYVKLSNSNNETSSSIYAESISLEILNIIFNLKLENSNLRKSNFPVIDLFDKSASTAFQVTSNETTGKIQQTIKTFLKDSLHNDFSNLFILVIGKKRRLNSDKIYSICKGKINFDIDSNIIDIQDLYKLIINSGSENLYKIEKLLNQQFKNKPSSYVVEQKKVALSYDERDLNELITLVKKLIENNYLIYTTNSIILDSLPGKIYDDNIVVLRASDIPLSIDACIFFFSRNSYKTKIEYRNECPILLRMYENDKQIISLQFGGDIHNVTKFGLNKCTTIFVKSDQFDKAISQINSKLISDESLFGDFEIEKILSLHDKNFKPLSEQFSDRKERVGYRIYAKYERALGDKPTAFCVSLFKGIYFEKTFQHILKNVQYIKRYIDSRQVFLVTPKEKNQRDYISRKKNLSKLFDLDISRIYYTDEYVWLSTPDEFKNNSNIRYLNINKAEFVFPFFSLYDGEESNNGSSNKIESERVIQTFNLSEGSSTLLLIGGGGVGKTTVAKHIADDFLENKSESSVIFLDSSEIVRNLSRQLDENDSIDLYDLYVANSHSNSRYDELSLLNRDLFETNFDNGNILVVIDGIDEIVTRVYNFNLISLIENIKSNQKSIGFGKLVITSRPGSFINDILENFKTDHSVSIFEVLPFNEQLARKYFEQKGFNPKKINKKIEELISLFNLKSQAEIFPPFILDVVSQIEEGKKYSDRIGSNYLNVDNVKIDYIIAQICNREIERVKQVPIDKQIQFLMEIAVKYKGRISESDLEKVAEKLSIPKEKMKNFTIHPLLILKGSDLYIKYDFFIDIFKSIYVVFDLFIDPENFNIGDYTIDILINDCKYSSSFIKEIVKRIPSKPDLIIDNGYVERIILVTHEKNMGEIQSVKAVSGFFNIALSLQNCPNDINSNTASLIRVFKNDDNVINYFYLYNMPADVIFNFSDLRFNNSIIIDYQAFFDCKFNEETFFSASCSIRNVGLTKPKNLTANPKNFAPMMETDGTFSQVFDTFSSNKQTNYVKATEILKLFFSIFEERGFYQEREYKGAMSRFNQRKSVKIVEFEDIEDTLRAHGIIEKVRREHIFLSISSNSKSDAESLCKQNFCTNKIDNVIIEIVEELM